jgi:hypothetical protein
MVDARELANGLRDMERIHGGCDCEEHETHSKLFGMAAATLEELIDRVESAERSRSYVMVQLADAKTEIERLGGQS